MLPTSIVVALCLALPGGTHARPAPSSLAAPGAVIARGPLMVERGVIADWQEKQRIVAAFSDATRDVPVRSMAGRAYVDLALYWGPEWKHLQNAPESAKRLRIDPANQRARLFLVHSGQPAAI